MDRYLIFIYTDTFDRVCIFGNMSKYHPFIMLIQFAEDFVCRACDTCISILPKTKEYLVSRGLNSKKEPVLEA